MRIVNVKEKHILAIRNIYAHRVLRGTDSFETDPPGAHEMLVRLGKIRSLGLPWVVALQEDKVIGYCYLTRYRERCTYRYTPKGSIYIAPTAQRQSVGRTLLRHAIGWVKAQGCRQLIAIVGDNNSRRSLKVHQQVGFMQIGILKNIGFKYELWLDTVLLQRNLDGDSDTLLPDSGVAI